MHGQFSDYHLAKVKSGVEWTGKMWNPIYGCTAVSPGCAHCYAARDAARWTNHFEGLAERTPNGGARWTGQIQFREDKLNDPLKYTQPHLIFVCGMSDLFHEDVPFEFIDRMFARMAMTPQHTYQVLTKRPERMLEYFSDLAYRTEMIGIEAEHQSGFDRFIWHTDDSGNGDPRWPLPLPNVWLGVSVENQAVADIRANAMWELAQMGWITWVSAEPLLALFNADIYLHFIKWIVIGGESGPLARPMPPHAARYLRDQAEYVGVPIFFKQWGEFDEHGVRVGKKQAGRLLDGREWNEFPKKVAA